MEIFESLCWWSFGKRWSFFFCESSVSLDFVSKILLYSSFGYIQKTVHHRLQQELLRDYPPDRFRSIPFISYFVNVPSEVQRVEVEPPINMSAHSCVQDGCDWWSSSGDRTSGHGWDWRDNANKRTIHLHSAGWPNVVVEVIRLLCSTHRFFLFQPKRSIFTLILGRKSFPLYFKGSRSSTIDPEFWIKGDHS